MVDTYTKVILTVIAAALLAQLLTKEIGQQAASQPGATCGMAADPCYVKFGLLDRPCGTSDEHPCFVRVSGEGATGSTR
jgi:hypothetical protein